MQQFDVLAPEIGLQFGLAGLGPVAVSANGIDLAVVRHHPEGMGQRPSGEGVRAVALVVDADCGLVVGIRKVREELLERRRDKQSLVDDQAMRHRGDVKTLDLVGGNAFLDFIAGKEESAFKLIGRHPVHLADKDLLNVGQRREGLGAQDLLVGGNIAPAEKVEPPLLEDLFGDGLGTGLGILVLLGKIHHPDTEIGIAVEGLTPALDDGTEEFVGDLGRNAGPVAGAGVGVKGTPVHQVADGAETDTEDLVGALTADSGHHADTAGVFFEGRVIKRRSALMMGQGMVHGVGGGHGMRRQGPTLFLRKSVEGRILASCRMSRMASSLASKWRSKSRVF